MAIVGTDKIYEMKIHSAWGLINSVNTLYYWNDDPTPSIPASGELLNGFNTSVIASLRALMHEDVTIVSLEARRLNNLTDFASLSIGLAGLATGTPMPPWVAFQVTKHRTTKATRSGWNNIMGVGESDTTDDGVTLTPAALLRLDAFADDLELTLTPTINNFVPVLVGFKYDYSTTPKTLRDEADWKYQEIQSVSSVLVVRHQTSRD